MIGLTVLPSYHNYDYDYDQDGQALAKRNLFPAELKFLKLKIKKKTIVQI